MLTIMKIIRSFLVCTLLLISIWFFTDLTDLTDYRSRRLSGVSKLPAVKINWSRSMNSIGWSSKQDPLHQKNNQCIDPAPFGRQCTVHRRDAILSCLNAKCDAVICPDQKPYFNGKPAKGIKGPICKRE